MELAGLSKQMRFGKKVAWFAGTISGLLGGLVGNQGGIRSAALLGFHVDSRAFVATATAVALAVDVARVPVYLFFQSDELKTQALVILIVIAGCILGTIVGAKFLRIIPEKVFYRSVALMIIGLGVLMFTQAGAS